MTSVGLAYLIFVLAGLLTLLYGFVRRGVVVAVWVFTFFPVMITAAESRIRRWSQIPEHLHDALIFDGYLLSGAVLLTIVFQVLTGGHAGSWSARAGEILHRARRRTSH